MNHTRWLATAAAALAVMLGGGAALESTGSSNPASDFLGDVAKRLGISQEKLVDEIKDAPAELRGAWASGRSIPMVRSPAASPVRTCSRRPPTTSA